MDEILCSAEDDFKSFVDPNEVVSETPHRCSNCSKLFFKGNVGVDGKVTVKCPRCHTTNIFTINTPPKNFQDRLYLNRRKNYPR